MLQERSVGGYHNKALEVGTIASSVHVYGNVNLFHVLLTKAYLGFDTKMTVFDFQPY